MTAKAILVLGFHLYVLNRTLECLFQHRANTLVVALFQKHTLSYSFPTIGSPLTNSPSSPPSTFTLKFVRNESVFFISYMCVYPAYLLFGKIYDNYVYSKPVAVKRP